MRREQAHALAVEVVERSTTEQGLPPTITDRTALDELAVAVLDRSVHEDGASVDAPPAATSPLHEPPERLGQGGHRVAGLRGQPMKAGLATLGRADQRNRTHVRPGGEGHAAAPQ